MKSKTVEIQQVSENVANTVPIMWCATILNANDRSGDGMIELPDTLLSQLDDEEAAIVLGSSATGIPIFEVSRAIKGNGATVPMGLFADA
jgi:hypothetical protein